jgi:8-oxo-dGTP pyrophosphatase MutT (NUDIX family)
MKKKNDMVQQAGVVPFFVSENEIHVMLITTRKQNRWIIPKGNIEKKLVAASASMEAYEEAGVKGIVLDEAGAFTYDKAGKIHNVTVFYFEIKKVLRKWPESRQRLRRLFSLEQAESLIADPKLTKMLRKLVPFVKNHHKTGCREF